MIRIGKIKQDDRITDEIIERIVQTNLTTKVMYKEENNNTFIWNSLFVIKNTNNIEEVYTFLNMVNMVAIAVGSTTNNEPYDKNDIMKDLCHCGILVKLNKYYKGVKTNGEFNYIATMEHEHRLDDDNDNIDFLLLYIIESAAGGLI